MGARAFTSSPVHQLRPWLPLVVFQQDALAPERDAFGDEERTLDVLPAAVPAEPAAGGTHPVRGHIGSAAAHEVADRAGGAGPAGQCGHLTVGGDPSGRNAAHDREDLRPERVGGGTRGPRRSAGQRSASLRTRPSAVGRGVALREASVGATSAGDAGALYFPGLMPKP